MHPTPAPVPPWQQKWKNYCSNTELQFRSLEPEKQQGKTMGVVTPTNTAVLEFRGIHLYHADVSNCAARVRLLLDEKGLPWESHHINLRRKENLTEEYFGINSKGLVPSLVHDGTVVVESNDILRYLEGQFPQPGFLPASEAARLKLDEWLQLSGDIHMPGIKTFQYKKVNSRLMKKTPEEVALYRRLQKHEDMLAFHAKHDTPGSEISEEDFSRAVAMLDATFARMNEMLSDDDWLIDNTYSLADISWAPTITTLARGGFSFERYHPIQAWYERVSQRPAFKSAVAAWQPGHERHAG
jgi:GST-like protein